jgi:predicted amidophosphoribosyltransferase
MSHDILCPCCQVPVHYPQNLFCPLCDLNLEEAHLEAIRDEEWERRYRSHREDGRRNP